MTDFPHIYNKTPKPPTSSGIIIGMKTLLLSFLALVCLTAAPALAQFNPNSITNPQLTIELQPEFPRPGEEVTATLNDYSGGVYGSTISWVIDGNEIPNTLNQRSISFVAGDNGVSQTIQAILSKPGGVRQVLRTNISPIYLDIVIEPQTKVPNFYLGRSLPSIGSLVNATALVSDNGVKNSQLVYTWRINQQVIDGGPLRGGNQVSFPMPMGDSAILSLRVTDLSGNVVSSRAVFIPSVTPEIHFYEMSTLFGMSQRPIDSGLPLIGNSVTIKAEPYHLDSRVYNNPDITEWQLNNSITSNTGVNPYEVTLQRTGSGGESRLQFHVRDTTQVLQGARGNVQINF